MKEKGKSTKLNKAQWVGALLIAGSIGLIVFQATSAESSVTFYTPAEVYADPGKFEGKTFRVSGLVLGGTKSWDAATRTLEFRMTDMGGHEFKVTYIGTPPDLFKEGQGVVVEGKLHSTDLKQDNRLKATLLMVKHSEVYDTSKDHSQLREAKLLDSIKKDEQIPPASN
jgi:cytochrome c-type biogenesis protein CcmE